MEISYVTAIWLVFLTSFMWAFWLQFVKKIDPWPLSAFMFWVFTDGAVFVWICLFALKDRIVPEGILTAILNAGGKAVLALTGGVGFSVGMHLQMYVVKKMGLVYSTSVVSTVSILLGTAFSSLIGGVPADTSFGKILFGSLILLAATLVCQWAVLEKSRFMKIPKAVTRADNRRYLLALAVYLLVFSQAYTIGMSASVRTDLNPTGLPGIAAVGVLSVGAAAGMWLLSGLRLWRSGRLLTLVRPPRPSCWLYAAIGGLCCLGGDLLHNIASPVVSVAIAWPLANLSGVWQYFWGLLNGEFSGAGKRAKALLAVGILLFITGVVWLAFARFGG